MSNTNTEVLTTAYENLQKAITQANKVLPNLEEAVEKGNLDNYATISQLEEKVDDIQIGTRNYLLNTGLKYDASSFEGLNAEVTRVTTMKTPSGNNCFYSKVSNKTNDVWRGANQEITSGFVIGDTMTFSLWTYVTNEIATDKGLIVEVFGLASDNSTRTFAVSKQANASDVNKWVKYELTFVIPKNTVKIKCWSYVVKNGSWYTGDYKLEKGNKATDWSPNPTDIYNAAAPKWLALSSIATYNAYKGVKDYSTELAPRISKDLWGRVYIEGCLTHTYSAESNANVLLFTLPEGYRPVKNHDFVTIASGNDKFNRISVRKDGTVTITYTNSTDATPYDVLEGITFTTY